MPRAIANILKTPELENKFSDLALAFRRAKNFLPELGKLWDEASLLNFATDVSQQKSIDNTSKLVFVNQVNKISQLTRQLFQILPAKEARGVLKYLLKEEWQVTGKLADKICDSVQIIAKGENERLES